MFLQGLDDIRPAAPLQGARLLADDFERAADALLGEELGDVQARVVVGRQDVVLGVEPEDDVDLGRRFGYRH